MAKTSKSTTKRGLLFMIVILLIGFAAIQFIRPEINSVPPSGEVKAPANVKAILERACYDCHSNAVNLRWYDQISPVYWKVAEHIREGRKVLNFSNWDRLSAPAQKAFLWESVNQIIAGTMPVKSYLFVHSSAKVSPEDLDVLKNYVNSMAPHKVADTGLINAAEKQYLQWQKGETTKGKLPTAVNGISYISDYKNWQPISTSERFDNGTMRVIFGNDIAVKAVKEHHIHPWPNGATFAKADWAQVEDKHGNVRPGAFLQVEFMIKDAGKYASTAGWGFARFKTAKKVPYGGSNVLFANECVNCHRPMKDEDFVFTQPIKR